MRKTISASIAGFAVTVISCTGVASDKIYAKFPVTLKGYYGEKTTSVSYTGQIARHVLHDSLKKLAGTGNGSANPGLKSKLMGYFDSKEAGRAIVAPGSKGKFVVLQKNVDEISKKKNLSGKTYKGTVAGMPNGMTGKELVTFWIDKASSATKGVDSNNGFNYPQLLSKYIMGAVSYNQAVDNYLDEKLSAEKKPNDKPYKKGAAYTGKEHSWDEAFGYFGAPAHVLNLTAKQAYAIAKRKPEALADADFNKDGKVDLKTEMVFGPAYYAAAFDKSGKTDYLHSISKAFLEGRKLISNQKGNKLSEAARGKLRSYAQIVGKKWEQVLAEATFKYAGSVYKDMMKLETIQKANGETSKQYQKYLKHWGELKGFSLALQSGKINLGETATRLNRMIGAGPLLLNASQVVDIDSKGNYVRDQGPSWGEYMLHMGKIQKLMISTFGVKAMVNDVTKDMASLADKLGDKSSAEND